MRRRSRPSFFARVRTFWVVAILAFVALCGAFAVFANTPQLRVRAVDVGLSGGAAVSKNAVLAAAAIGGEANVLLLNTGAIRRRVEAIPYVQDARVQRRLVPQPSVRLEVSVRRPSACLRAARGSATIDPTARVLQTGCAAGDLPLIELGTTPIPAPGARLEGPDLTKLLADTATVAARIPLRAIGRDRFGGIEAVDRTGVTIRLGADGDLEAKLALVEPIRRAVGHGRRIRAIDLRAPATPVVEFP